MICKDRILFISMIIGIFILSTGCPVPVMPDVKPTPTPVQSIPTGNSTTKVSIDGVIHKGPFLEGTSITIQELDKELNPTGRQYTVYTKDNTGSFSFRGDFGAKIIEVTDSGTYFSDQPATEYVEIIAEGYFFNENTGETSDGELTLSMIAKIGKTNATNINILTALTKERIKYLILNDKKDFEDARIQAEKEVLKAFYIEKGEHIQPFSSMNITRTGESNAVLLAISSILCKDTPAGDLSEFVSIFKRDIETDGILNSTKLINSIKTKSMAITPVVIKNNLTIRYTDLGETISIPDFEKYIDSDGDGIILKNEYNLLSPKGIVSDTNVTLRWDAAALENTTYKIQVSKSSDFSTIIEEKTDIAGTEYPLTTLPQHNTTYYWRVYIVDADGIATLTAPAESYTIFVPGITGLTVDDNNGIDTTPAVSWNAHSLATNYHVVIDDTSDFSSPVIDAKNVTATSYTVTQNLADNTTYYVHVSAVDKKGVENTPAYKMFKIELPVPANTASAFTSSFKQPLFTWDNTTGAEAYTIQISKNSDLSLPVVNLDVTESQYRVTSDLDTNTTYYWRTRIKNSDGVYGSWTALSSRDIPASADITDGLVAYFPCDGNLNDASGNGNNPISYGYDVVFTTDRYGNTTAAMAVDGNYTYNRKTNDIAIPHTFSLHETDWTVSFWIKPTFKKSIGGYTIFADLLHEVKYHQDYSQFSMLETNLIGFRDTQLASGYSNVDSTIFTENNWHNITVVYSRANKRLKVYLNNKLIIDDERNITQKNQFPSTYYDESSILFGSAGMKGAIDDVRLYNRALNEFEIKLIQE